MRKLLIALAVICFPVLMVLLVYAVNSVGSYRVLFALLCAAIALGYLVFYGFYSLQVSMGTVLGIEVTDKVVHLITKRKTFTYDVKRGCIRVRAKRSRYICTFQTQDSRDSFIFWKHAPFSRYSDEQFSREEIARFYPDMDEVEEP